MEQVAYNTPPKHFLHLEWEAVSAELVGSLKLLHREHEEDTEQREL